MSKVKSEQSRRTARPQKSAVRQLLKERDLNDIRGWIKDHRNPFRTLTSLLFDDDELIRWRAVEAIGIASGIKFRDDPDSARRLVRRFFWLMNDESGGICWNAPEVLAEIIINVPQLIEEYAPLFVAYLKEEPFERGAHWAIARVAAVRPDIYEGAVEKLARSLYDPNPHVRGHTVMALKAIGTGTALKHVADAGADPPTFVIYDFNTGELVKTRG